MNGTATIRFVYCLDRSNRIRYMRSLQGHSGGVLVDPKLQNNVEIPYGWTDKFCHGGSALDCRSKSEGGLIAGSFRVQRGSASVTAVDPVNFPLLAPRVEENKPRLLPHRLKMEKVAQRSPRVRICSSRMRQTTANAIILHASMLRRLLGHGGWQEPERHRSRKAAPKRDSARNLSQVKHPKFCQAGTKNKSNIS